MITINHNTRRHISPAVAAAIAASLLLGGNEAFATSFGDAPNYRTSDPQLKIGSVIVREADTRGWDSNGLHSDTNSQQSSMAQASGSANPMGDISISVNDQTYRGVAPLHHERNSHGLEYLKSDPTTLYTQDHQRSANVSVEVSRTQARERSLMHPMTRSEEASDNFKVRGGTVILQEATNNGSRSEQLPRSGTATNPERMIGEQPHL